MALFRKALGAAALGAALGTTPASAVVVSTGFGLSDGFTELPTGIAVLAPGLGAGWSTGSVLTLVDVANDQYIVLDGGESLSLTLSGLTIGQTYDLQVGVDRVGYRSPSSNTTQALLEITNDIGLGTRRLDETFANTTCDPSGFGLASACQLAYAAALEVVPRESVGWAPFVATASTLTLTFAAMVNTNGVSHLALDNVRVAVTAVPEPETWALMLAGVFTFGLLLRRRRSQR